MLAMLRVTSWLLMAASAFMFFLTARVGIAAICTASDAAHAQTQGAQAGGLIAEGIETLIFAGLLTAASVLLAGSVICGWLWGMSPSFVRAALRP